MIAVDDQLVLMDDRRTAESMHAGESTGRDFPPEFAVEIVCRDHDVARRTLVAAAEIRLKKGHIHQITVRGGSRRGEAVQLVPLLKWSLEHALLPQDVAACSIERQQYALFSFFDAGEQKNAIVPDDGRPVTPAWQLSFPQNVLACFPIPSGWNVFFDAAAVATRASPAGPVFPARLDGEGEQANHRQGQAASKHDDLILLVGLFEWSFRRATKINLTVCSQALYSTARSRLSAYVTLSLAPSRIFCATSWCFFAFLARLWRFLAISAFARSASAVA